VLGQQSTAKLLEVTRRAPAAAESWPQCVSPPRGSKTEPPYMSIPDKVFQYALYMTRTFSRVG